MNSFPRAGFRELPVWNLGDGSWGFHVCRNLFRGIRGQRLNFDSKNLLVFFVTRILRSPCVCNSRFFSFFFLYCLDVIRQVSWLWAWNGEREKEGKLLLRFFAVSLHYIWWLREKKKGRKWDFNWNRGKGWFSPNSHKAKPISSDNFD